MAMIRKETGLTYAAWRHILRQYRGCWAVGLVVQHSLGWRYNAWIFPTEQEAVVCQQIKGAGFIVRADGETGHAVDVED